MALTKITGQVVDTTTDLVVGVTTDGGGVSAVDGFFSGIVTFSQGVSIGGTLTYEDVTNIDSVGLITARAGVVVGSGVTLSKDGDGFFTGVVTATSYAGDGSGLTGIDATQIVTGNTSVQTVDTGSDGHVKVNTEGSERLRIIADGKVGVNKTAPNFHLDVAGNVGLTEGQVITWHDGSGTKAGDIFMDSSDNFIIRNTSSVSERLRIDSSGRLLLGTTTEGHDNAENLTVSASGAAGITIRSTGNNCHLYFSDATSGAGEYVGQITYNHSSDYMNFITNGTERARISSGGDVTVSTGNLVIGTAGKGIDFSAQTATSASGASATSELLDHYEEGTWTPTLTTSNGGSYSASHVTGHYTRIGRIVHAHFQFNSYGNQLTDIQGSGSSSDSVTGGGLPFPTASGSPEYYQGDIGFYALNFPSSLDTGTLNLYAYMGANSSNFQFYLPRDNAASQLVTVGQFGQGYIRGCLHYIT